MKGEVGEKGPKATEQDYKDLQEFVDSKNKEKEMSKNDYFMKKMTADIENYGMFIFKNGKWDKTMAQEIRKRMPELAKDIAKKYVKILSKGRDL